MECGRPSILSALSEQREEHHDLFRNSKIPLGSEQVLVPQAGRHPQHRPAALHERVTEGRERVALAYAGKPKSCTQGASIELASLGLKIYDTHPKMSNTLHSTDRRRTEEDRLVLRLNQGLNSLNYLFGQVLPLRRIKCS